MIEFTQEQKDAICERIGEWYLKWKGADLNKNIGRAKEELKTMVCENMTDAEYMDKLEGDAHL